MSKTPERIKKIKKDRNIKKYDGSPWERISADEEREKQRLRKVFAPLRKKQEAADDQV